MRNLKVSRHAIRLIEDYKDACVNHMELLRYWASKQSISLMHQEIEDRKAKLHRYIARLQKKQDGSRELGD